MSLTYEEALDTLTSMFGPPWTKETLDAVLRHHQGHMENTVETVLNHGDGDPQELVKKLKSGLSNDRTSMDAELARQLARQERGGSSRTTTRTTQASRAPAPPPPPKPKGRGTHTELPPDFLRIPGQPQGIDQDEALARMLQDELFSQELANNPEFAHLARGRPRTAGGLPVRSTSGRGRVGELPRRTGSTGSHRSQGGGGGGGEEGPKIMEKISELGENAKRRLAMMAAQFNATRMGQGGGGGTNPTANAAAQEQRGLLDGDGDEQEMELTFSSSTGKKDA